VPLTAVGGRLPAVLNKNGPDRLLARGMLGGNVEKLFHGLWLVTTELVHKGSVAAPEAAPSSLKVSSRVVCREGIRLCTIPINMALESPSWGERLRWLR
jgi:hypothetical protein